MNTLSQKNILVTGGAGYIGSHTILLLLQAGYHVIALDNLCNSSVESLVRVEQIAGCAPIFIKGDICDRTLLDQIFLEHSIYAVLHFAGLKSVSESVYQPLRYYENNLVGTITLCQAMENANVFKLVFSSSATVYGNPSTVPIREDQFLNHPTNPYGRSKLLIEQVLVDLATANSLWSIALLRYFNPVGAHESGLIGEDPNGTPNNLLPYISQVAIGKLPELPIFGNDYPTLDGTGVRDYIHVMDLARGHLCALETLYSYQGSHIWNLGTGIGYSVLEIVKAFEAVSGRSIPYHISSRRPGDVAICYADPSKAERDLHWKAQYGLLEMIRDTWHWQLQNPNGYTC